MGEEERSAIAAQAASCIASKGGAPDVRPEDLKLAMVEADTVVLSFTPAELGSPGTDVQGQALAGLPGNDPYIQSVYGATLGPQGVRNNFV